MGTGNAKTDNSDIKYLGFQTKDDENPHFKVVKKNPTNGKYEKTEEITWFDGWLIEAKMGVYTPKDNSPPKPTIIMVFRDGVDVMQLETGFSMMSRTMINAFANLEKLGKIKVSLYTSSSNGKANIWIENNGEKCDWKYDWENHQKPLVFEYDKGEGEIGKNYKKLNDFFTEVLIGEVQPLIQAQDLSVGAIPERDELQEAVDKQQQQQQQHEGSNAYQPDSAAPTPASTDLPVVEEESDDLPF